MVKTRIICTLGPASSSQTVIRKMMLAGMDAARINFSHGTHNEIVERIKLIRGLNSKLGRNVRILGDLQGHRIRIGELESELILKKNRVIWLTQKKIKGGQDTIPFDYQGPLRAIKKGAQIFIDDGNIALEVMGRSKDKIKARITTGGILKERKGMNIPDVKLEFKGINEKDARDTLFCERHKFDYIAQSFVRAKKDVLEVRSLLKSRSQIKIIAKIENRQGIENIDDIIEASDGIMIARGDMGVSIPVYEVPVVQKMIIRKCNRAGKFVITATQMLESMVENGRPTRAEVTDVANAIIDGTDFVMLSAESAVGKYPVQAVSMMNNIIKFTEGYLKSGRR